MKIYFRKNKIDFLNDSSSQIYFSVFVNQVIIELNSPFKYGIPSFNLYGMFNFFSEQYLYIYISVKFGYN